MVPADPARPATWLDVRCAVATRLDMSAPDRWTGGPQPGGRYAVGQSVTVNDNSSSPGRAPVPALRVAVAGFSNPHFGYASESGQGVSTIEAIAFESSGDLVATGGRCMGNVRNCSGDQIGSRG